MLLLHVWSVRCARVCARGLFFVACLVLEGCNRMLQNMHMHITWQRLLHIDAAMEVAGYGVGGRTAIHSFDSHLFHRVTGWLDSFHHSVFYGVETRRFGNWICFRPQVKGGEDTYSAGPLRKS
jgi:hypothetical protein